MYGMEILSGMSITYQTITDSSYDSNETIGSSRLPFGNRIDYGNGIHVYFHLSI